MTSSQCFTLKVLNMFSSESEVCTCTINTLLPGPENILSCWWLRFHLISYFSYGIPVCYIPLVLIVYSFPPKCRLNISSNTTDTNKYRGQGLVLHPHIQSVLPKQAPTDNFLRAGILNLLFLAPRAGGSAGEGVRGPASFHTSLQT